MAKRKEKVFQLPNNEPWNNVTNLSHYTGVKSICNLKSQADRLYSIQICTIPKPKRKMKIALRIRHWQRTSHAKEFAYPYPEKKCYLKSILEKDKVNQEEDNVGPMKPKEII